MIRSAELQRALTGNHRLTRLFFWSLVSHVPNCKRDGNGSSSPIVPLR